MIKRILKLVLGVCLIPLCLAFSRAFFHVLMNLTVLGKAQQFFLAGIIVYVPVHLFIARFDYMYVLAHETVHALFAWLFGAKIKAFKVSSKGGSVSSTKSNFIITLAPYFIPFYTVVLSLAFFELHI